jgi:hypothetical protein
MAQMGRIAMDGPSRDRVAAVAGILSVVVFVVGQYVAPALVWPGEQISGLVATFYVNFEGRLLAEAILFGVAGALFLVFLGGLWAVLGRASRRGWPRSWSLPGPWWSGWCCCRRPS